jgi:RecB family exonuclease
VVDYKTGSSKPRAEELARHPQLGAYQLGVEGGAFGELGTQDSWNDLQFGMEDSSTHEDKF